VLLDLAADYGKAPLTQLKRSDGIWTARLGDLHVRWTGAPDARRHGRGPRGGLYTEITVAAGEQHDLVLEIGVHLPADRPPAPDEAWRVTETSWAAAVPPLSDCLSPEHVRSSLAVLRGLTSWNGGMVAAATTSLPERAQAGRNYDYRYVWIRDQCYAGQAVAVNAPHPLLDDAVRFVAERLLADGPHLKPAYTITGGPVPDQRSLDLPGYPGGRDIVGNHVNAQFQLDALGEALLLFAAAARHDHLGTDHYRAVTAAISAITQRWREPDAGIWELDNHRWAHSRLICAAGLRAIATAGVSTADAAEWSALADTIVADTGTDCLHPSGRWQRAPDDPRVDAALLLPAIRGALPAADPRSVATVRAVLEQLTQQGYVYRFRQDARPPGEAEGAFTLCGFVMALADHQQGDPLAARSWFERSRAACGPPGLFSEEYDVTQRQLRGNLPQAFVHALMIEAAIRLGRPWADPTHR
ncbi:MAG: glycoside hydrolase family 15 protein, partial [Pseudonocardiales bacterium]|nr:glycoside hydrolase family 15 protein [Pseudonocardiales bacterium]